METLDPATTRPFFETIAAKFRPSTPCACIVTTHLLRDRPYFLDALNGIARIISLTPKPKSIHSPTLSWLSCRYPVDRLTREDLHDPEILQKIIDTRLTSNERLLFVDVGGYYCSSLEALSNRYQDRLLGVVEDTENGHQRYSKRPPHIPVISVARSPLKNPEDFLVGQSIVFSVEAIIRQAGDIMQGRTSAVLGYGKLGRSIAGTLRERHVETIVVEPDSVRAVEARSHGFHVLQEPKGALRAAGLVFCATGNISLRLPQFRLLAKGCYVATATSSDDELDTVALRATYRRRRVGDLISRYESLEDRTQHFYLLNHGQAVNFIHGAVVGPFIYLVQAELIAAAGLLGGSPWPDMEPPPKNSVSELPESARDWIAKAWLDAFRDA